jgi:hypothetical protein
MHRRRWIFWLLGIVLGLGILVLIALELLLPAIIQRQVAGVFRKAGFTDAKFDLQKATLWHTTVANVAAGQDQWLKIGNVAIEYSPFDVLRGDIDTVRVRNGRLVVSVDDLLKAQGGTDNALANARIPVESIELDACTLLLRRGENGVEVPLDGTLLRAPNGSSQLNIRAMLGPAKVRVAGVIEPPGGGRTDVNGDAIGVELASLVPLLPSNITQNIASASGTIDLRAEHHRAPATLPSTSFNLELNNGGVGGRGKFDGQVQALYGKVHVDSLIPLVIPPGQWLTIGTMKISGQELSGARLVFDATDSDHIHIADAQVSWAGGRFNAKPFTISISEGNIATEISAQHIDLAQVVALLTSGRGSGTGRISGAVQVAFDGSRFTFGAGKLASEGPGNLRLGSMSGQLETVLDRTNPRFTTEAAMQQLKQQIIAALTDFDYDSLSANFTREGGRLVVSVQITGQGREGAKQPFDITLNFRGVEDALNTYLQTRKSVFELGQ